MYGAAYFLVFAVLVSLVAAWFDWRTGHIPNAVTLGPLGLGLLAHFMVPAASHHLSAALEDASMSVLGAAACAIVPLTLYRLSAIGGGDVKLLAAIGALCGLGIGVEAELYAFLLAAVFAPARLAWEGKLLRVLGNTVALLVNPFLPEGRKRALSPEMLTSLRFGPAIFAGTTAAVLMHWRALR